MICAQIGKELPDRRQKEGRIEFIRVGDVLRICLQCRRPWFKSCIGKICWRRDRLPTPVFLGFPCGSDGKESARIAVDLGDPWVGKIPWRKERLPTPVFWPREFHGLYSLGHKQLDTTEPLSFFMEIP